MELLKKFAQPKGERLLLTEKGTTLVSDVNRRDAIKLTLDRLLTKVNKQTDEQGELLPQIKGSFKVLRATGADLIAQQYDEPLADLWMAHAPSGVAQKHYLAPNQPRLDEAVAWLGEQIGDRTKAKDQKQTKRKGGKKGKSKAAV